MERNRARVHRVHTEEVGNVLAGHVRYAPLKSIWFNGMLASAIVGGLATVSLGAVVLWVVSTALVLLLGHSIGNHRLLVHRSFESPLWLERTLLWFGTQVGLAGPLGLVRQHDLRDHAQRQADCHPYLRHGNRWWRDAWWQLNCDLELREPPQIRIEPRLASDRYLHALERTWMLQQVPLAAVFFLWGGWAFVFWGVCARIAAAVFGHWAIGFLAHNHGPMPQVVRGAAVQGRNIRWASLLTMGECWHNNHHAWPGSARLGLRKGEWDPGWWLLVALRRARLVWNIRLPQDLPARSELSAAGEPSRPRGGYRKPGDFSAPRRASNC
jgi:fatty-acid desaturase